MPVVFEEMPRDRMQRDRAVLWGIGISAFVDSNFLRALKAGPAFWIGPELTRRCAEARPPLLSDREIRQANSGEGLNLVVWEACTLPAYAARQDAYDEELTRELHLSLSAVKKTWQTIYTRVSERIPELIAVPSRESRRDKEKRHCVLAYMTSHPEELRPRADLA